MNRRLRGMTVLMLLCAGTQARGADPKKQKKPPEPSMLDKYLNSASATTSEDSAVSSPGSIWSASARLDDLARDLRANRVDDVVTIVVTETINAAASGNSTTERASSANASITSLAGPKAEPSSKATCSMP